METNTSQRVWIARILAAPRTGEISHAGILQVSQGPQPGTRKCLRGCAAEKLGSKKVARWVRRQAATIPGGHMALDHYVFLPQRAPVTLEDLRIRFMLSQGVRGWWEPKLLKLATNCRYRSFPIRLLDACTCKTLLNGPDSILPCVQSTV